MANHKSITLPWTSLLSLLLLSLTITYATAARILDEEKTPVPTTTPGSVTTQGGNTATVVGAAKGVDHPLDEEETPVPTTAQGEPGSVTTQGGNTAAAVGAAKGADHPLDEEETPVTTTAQGGPGSVTTQGENTAAVVGAAKGADHPLVFFMHDILGGTNPSARAVTGIVTNPAVSAQVPFAKPNGANLPLNSGVPINSNNNGIVSNNNIPFLTGLGGTRGNNNGVVQNNGNNNLNNGIPVLSGGQVSTGSTLQKLMFGTLTAFDDELTEGHELGSGLIGKAQGFYVASSIDGSSQTMAFTAMFERGGYVDSISFLGVHRTVVSESQLAVMGGTGKYVNAKGFATVKTLAGQQNGDGLDTLLELTVYLTY